MEKTKKNSKKNKLIIVLIAIVIFVLYCYISYRSNYLQTLEIGEEYLRVFEQNYEYKSKLFVFNFAVIFLAIYITNKLIKKGLKVFFSEEKKELPKLPNKSLAFLLSIVISIAITTMFLDKFILFINNTWFGINDPIFGLDIGFYFFQKPFIHLIIYYVIGLLIFLTLYTAAYYIVVFNVYLDGIDKETLLKSGFIKSLKVNCVLIVIAIACNIFLSTYNIFSDEFITLKDVASTKIRGAGFTDVTIRLWGYRLLAPIMIISVILIVKYIFEKKEIKKLLKSICIVPAYLVSLFIIIIIFNIIFVNTNKLEKEKEYIGYNIEYTKAAYSLNIEEKEIENSGTINKDKIENNKDIINNINIVNTDITLKNLNLLQTNSGYYSYRTTKLQKYILDGKDTIIYVSPRELEVSSDTSLHNKTYEYTHGFGSIITYANKVDMAGNIEYVEKGFNQSENPVYVMEPRIYYGLQTNNTVIVDNKDEQEYDYPINSTTAAKTTYTGKSGIKVNFIDKLILSFMNKDINVTFLKTDENSKVLLNRNVIKRAQKIMPYLIYDENPYLVITDEGKQYWIMDAYTISNNYPYAQKTIIKNNNSRKEINYIRNSVKVIVDAYNGTTNFYITDNTDPIVIAYSHAYTNLFKDISQIPENIKAKFVYPEYLYNVQSEVLKLYHNVTEDVLYRGNDIWDCASYSNTLKSTLKVDIAPYYTMVEDGKIGLILPYTVYGKQNISSYLIGYVNNDGINQLKLYKFLAGSNVLGPEQLDKEIEQDELISNEINSVNVTGTKIIKDIVIVPIDNSLLYVEPIYQQQLNDKNGIPLLKKVVVASGNKVAIGNNITEALDNLVSQSAVNIKVESDDTFENIINSIIETNKNLKDSTTAQDFELIGKDISKMQELIKQLEEEKKILDAQTEKEEKDKNLNDNNNLEIIE